MTAELLGRLETGAVTAAEVRLLDLPLVEPFVASHGTTTSRRLTVIEVTTERATGWGECAALPSPTYSAETADGAFDLLVEVVGETGVLDGVPGSIDEAVRRANPMSMAAIDMALIDAALTADERALVDVLGAERTRVPAGVAIGMAPPDQIEETTARLVADGYRRLKLKIGPGHDVDPITAATSALGERGRGGQDPVQLHVDANGTYDAGPAGVEHLVDLAERFDLAGFEQPFAVDDRDSAVALVAALAAAGRSTLVVADEAVGSLADARSLLSVGALTAVSIKPSRLGGVAAAVEVGRYCLDHGLAATAGGMVESGLGRHNLAAVAALDCFTVPGDLSPAGRWLRHDPWPDLVMDDGAIVVPAGPGVAPEPDRSLLDSLTVRRATIVR